MAGGRRGRERAPARRRRPKPTCASGALRVLCDTPLSDHITSPSKPATHRYHDGEDRPHARAPRSQGLPATCTICPHPSRHEAAALLAQAPPHTHCVPAPRMAASTSRTLPAPGTSLTHLCVRPAPRCAILNAVSNGRISMQHAGTSVSPARACTHRQFDNHRCDIPCGMTFYPPIVHKLVGRSADGGRAPNGWVVGGRRGSVTWRSVGGRSVGGRSADDGRVLNGWACAQRVGGRWSRTSRTTPRMMLLHPHAFRASTGYLDSAQPRV